MLPIFNSGEIVMSHENSKNFTYAFRKSGALHSRIPRASKASLIPISRPLTFEEKTHKLGKKNWRLLQK
jgi:hypothetical protein